MGGGVGWGTSCLPPPIFKSLFVQQDKCFVIRHKSVLIKGFITRLVNFAIMFSLMVIFFTENFEKHVLFVGLMLSKCGGDGIRFVVEDARNLSNKNQKV